MSKPENRVPLDSSDAAPDTGSWGSMDSGDRSVMEELIREVCSERQAEIDRYDGRERMIM